MKIRYLFEVFVHKFENGHLTEAIFQAPNGTKWSKKYIFDERGLMIEKREFENEQLISLEKKELNSLKHPILLKILLNLLL